MSAIEDAWKECVSSVGDSQYVDGDELLRKYRELKANSADTEEAVEAFGRYLDVLGLLGRRIRIYKEAEPHMGPPYSIRSFDSECSYLNWLRRNTKRLPQGEVPYGRN